MADNIELITNPQKLPVPITFSGKAKEYFVIWIMNIILSIITLGIYSAWAKVRSKKYFYANTSIMGSSFDYLASGWTILKGRIIAVVIFGMYIVALEMYPSVVTVAPLAFLLLLPYLINSGLRFNARNSTWRGIRFDFKGSYFGALFSQIVYPVLGIISLGLAMPWAMSKAAKYIVTGHSFGNEPFKFSALTADYIKPIIILLASFIVAIIAFWTGVTNDSAALMIFGAVIFYGSLFAFQPVLLNIYWNNVSLKSNDFDASLPIGGFIWMFLSNSLVAALSLGLMIPWAQVRMANFMAEHIVFIDARNVNQIIATQHKHQSSIGEELGEVFDVDVGFGV